MIPNCSILIESRSSSVKVIALIIRLVCADPGLRRQNEGRNILSFELVMLLKKVGNGYWSVDEYYADVTGNTA